MSIRAPFGVDEYYHLYNRGTDKRTIFLEPKDYARFLALLYLCNSTESVRFDNLSRNEQGKALLRQVFETRRSGTLVSIGAYCLMPNHFHLLLKSEHETGISRFMQKLLTAYTMYFNVKNERKGTLFEGKFKSQHADDDRYLKYLFSYIHLNPVKIIEPRWKEIGINDRAAVEKFLKEYSYSSYQDYLGKDRPEKHILDTSTFPNYFGSRKLLEAHVNDWLDYSSSNA